MQSTNNTCSHKARQVYSCAGPAEAAAATAAAAAAAAAAAFLLLSYYCPRLPCGWATLSSYVGSTHLGLLHCLLLICDVGAAAAGGSAASQGALPATQKGDPPVAPSGSRASIQEWSQPSRLLQPFHCPPNIKNPHPLHGCHTRPIATA